MKVDFGEIKLVGLDDNPMADAPPTKLGRFFMDTSFLDGISEKEKMELYKKLSRDIKPTIYEFSYITFEIVGDGDKLALAQAKGFGNTLPAKEDKEFLEYYCKKMDLVPLFLKYYR